MMSGARAQDGSGENRSEMYMNVDERKKCYRADCSA